ncbi:MULTISPECIES: HAD-IIIC family phosphatase [Pseudomonas fluorescens group]|uniref:Putative fatty-acid--CoA ligase fadD21 n=1 Tax=Pseudomonas fluorescens TaxID=294 RepID=A0A0D0RT39_PSEFL|nr:MULTISPECIES: HAD-IIIC family phosphatase [Pseudomonas fluorescens group]AZE63486.1 Polyketide synthase [Pseudomonas synxantha]KIR22672.1 putative fatty-acid--CoA ligase fadD21 [Pseudomonas fluorescens]
MTASTPELPDWSGWPKPSVVLDPIALLRTRAERQPDEIAVWLVDRRGHEITCTWHELNERATAVAWQLQSSNARRAVIVASHGVGFLAALFGCMAAGATAIPVPGANSRSATDRWQVIFQDAQPDTFISASRPDSLPVGMQWIDCHIREAPSGFEGKFDPSRVAIIQYTSGSTAKPRGVLVDGYNLSAQQRSLRDIFGHTAQSRVLTWLPAYHDMGLIGGLLQPLYAGIPCVWLSMTAFLASPLTWLQAISRYRATTSGGPNFAYDNCVTAMGEQSLEGLDLSSWRVAFNGSEAVRAQTLERFTRKFASYGFNRDAFFPCYGLAEATLMATGPVPGTKVVVSRFDRDALSQDQVVPSASDNAVALVSSGVALPGSAIAIVSAQSRMPVSSGQVGEILLSGPGVVSGYLGGRDESRFSVRLPQDERRWLATGDMGFVEDSNLYVVGRLDDVLNVRGRKHSAEEMEQAVCAVFADDSDVFVAVVGVAQEDGDEAVVLIETTFLHAIDAARVSQITQLITQNYGVSVAEVAWLAPRSLPRTTSGKLQRSKARDLWAEGKLNQHRLGDAGPEIASHGRTEPAASTADAFSRAFSQVLPGADIGEYSNFFAAGGDSLKVHALRAQLEQSTGLNVELADIFEAPTPASLRARIMTRGAQPGSAAVAPDLGELAPAQRRIWFSEHMNVGFSFYHVGLSFDISGLQQEEVERALQKLIASEPALRTVFFIAAGEPRQRVLQTADVRLRVVGAVPADDIPGVVLDEVSTAFDLSQSVVRALILNGEAGECRLVLTVHHIVCDGWGARRLIERMSQWLPGMATKALSLPVITEHDYLKQCALSALNARNARSPGMEFFRQMLADSRGSVLPLDFERPLKPALTGGRCRSRMDAQTLERLSDAARRECTTPFAVLLSALGAMVRFLSDSDEAVIGTVVSLLPGAQHDGAMSCDINFLPLLICAHDQTSISSWVEQVSTTLASALNHSATAFEDLVQAVNPDRTRGGNPLYSVGLWFNDPSSSAVQQAVELVETPTAELDLRFIVTPLHDGTANVVLEYASELFMESSARRLLDTFLVAADAMIRHPQWLLSDFASLLQKVAQPRAVRRLSIAANFTVEPALDALNYWSRRLELPLSVNLAPYDQVELQLLQPGQQSVASSNERFIVLDPDAWVDEAGGSERVSAFIQLLESQPALRRELTLFITPGLSLDTPRSEAVRLAREQLLALAGEQWKIVDLATVEGGYNTGPCRSPYTDELGRNPFSPTWLTGLGTVLFRHTRSAVRQSRKVLVLDCDNTLWDGECASSISIPSHKIALQQAILRLSAAGVVLALCTRNRPEDVIEAFAHPDMLLSRDNIAAMEASWDPKSQSLQRLATQLSLGTDSFVLLDDDPAICAEVRSNCPDVCVITLPESSLLQACTPYHLWEFDGLGGTSSDLSRASAYALEAKRKRAQFEAPDLESYLAGLETRVDSRRAQPDDLSRIAQLSQRTNQFNASDFRATESDLIALKADLRVAQVQDRFGDYGMTCAALVFEREERLDVDAFFVSCRVLGRGAEGLFLASLQDEARSRGLVELRVRLRKTARNIPAREFFESLRDCTYDKASEYFIVPLDATAAPSLACTRQTSVGRQLRKASPAVSGVPLSILERADVRAVLAATNASPLRTVRRQTYIAPEGAIEQGLATILADVLRVDRVGTTDNFFELGGHSLLALRVVWRIQEDFGVSVTLAAFYDRPTLSGLAESVLDALVLLDGSDALSNLVAENGIVK